MVESGGRTACSLKYQSDHGVRSAKMLGDVNADSRVSHSQFFHLLRNIRHHVTPCNEKIRYNGKFAGSSCYERFTAGDNIRLSQFEESAVHKCEPGCFGELPCQFTDLVV
jgi:hypothetical protein